MSTMDCREFANQLDEWVRGERTAAARVHARNCKNCQGLAEDFGAIVKSAREWATEEVAPSPRVWSSLRAQLQEEGLIRDGAEQGRRVAGRSRPDIAPRPVSSGWLDGWFAGALRPAIAGAYLAVLVAFSVMCVGPTGKQLDDSRWLASTRTSITPLNVELNSAERSVLSNLASVSPVVAASLHENLAIVDNDISLCEKSVREEPENELARDYLYQAYEQKADLLSEMTDRGVDNP
jgi:fermentation-respiration switch protein FrsA (DUF1100 family)